MIRQISPFLTCPQISRFSCDPPCRPPPDPAPVLSLYAHSIVLCPWLCSKHGEFQNSSNYPFSYLSPRFPASLAICPGPAPALSPHVHSIVLCPCLCGKHGKLHDSSIYPFLTCPPDFPLLSRSALPSSTRPSTCPFSPCTFHCSPSLFHKTD
jgi:hypothetical protein